MMTREELFRDPSEWMSFHDAVMEVTHTEHTREELQTIFNQLPANIQDTAHAHGLSDTVFRDEAYTYLKKNYYRSNDDGIRNT